MALSQEWITHMIKQLAFLFAILVMTTVAFPAEKIEEEDNNSLHNSNSIFLERLGEPKNSHIVKLDLSRDKDLHDLNFIRFFPNLIQLDLSNSDIGDNYYPISQLIKLEKLNLFRTELTTAKHITPLKNLIHLKITCPHIGNAVKYIKQLPNLMELDINGGVKGVEKIAKLTSLKRLTLSCIFNQDEGTGFDLDSQPLDFLSSLINLRRLDLSHNDYIFCIKPLTKLPQLTHLNLEGCHNIRDLRRLNKIESLTRLDLRYMNSMCIPTLTNDLKKLAKLRNLKILVVSESIKLPIFSEEVRIIRE